MLVILWRAFLSAATNPMYHSVMNYALSGGSVEAQQEEHLTEMILPECPREMQALLGLLNDG